MKQLGLFDKPLPVKRADPQVPAEANPRLDAACYRIITALRDGPKDNIQLAAASIGGQRFGARLHELARAGWIWAKKPVAGTGEARWIYTLVREPLEASE